MITDKVGGSSAKPEVSKQSKEKRLKHKVSGYKSQSKRRLIAGCRLLLRTLPCSTTHTAFLAALATKYSTSLTNFHKASGTTGDTIVKIGDVVQIYSDERSRLKWRLGVVEGLIRGVDI